MAPTAPGAHGPREEGRADPRGHESRPDNYANPRGLSFLPPRTQGSAAARRGTTPRPKLFRRRAHYRRRRLRGGTGADGHFGGQLEEGDPKVLPKYTLAEVAKHCTKDDAWVDRRARVRRDAVHRAPPGRRRPDRRIGGEGLHRRLRQLPRGADLPDDAPGFLIGEMAAGEIVVAARRRLPPHPPGARRGLETPMGYCGRWRRGRVQWLGALYLSLGGASCAMRMAGAAAMGVFWQQLAGIGHDLGHSGVTHDFHLDHKIGSAISAFMGLSVGWWKSDHNTHHVVCNAIEHDPNVQHMPMLAITSKIFARARFWDTYHRKWVGMDDVAHALVSYQHFFCYPLLSRPVEPVRAAALPDHANENETTHFPKTELCEFAIYFAWMLGVALSMPTWFEAVSWLMVSHGVSGVVLLQLAMGHWSMQS